VPVRRAAWDLSPNPLARALAARRAAGGPLHDLCDANPTHAGLAPAAALAEALAARARDPASARYEPDPRGDPGARAAVAAYHGGGLAPEHVLLTAGTSEGYAHLFRVLADPGDRVHLPSPGYPLFEHLAGLEGLEPASYPLRMPQRGASWRVDLDALAAGLGPRSRAIVVIHPHNPTGSFLDPDDLASLRAIARERGLALISDEVFADYGLAGPRPAGLLAAAQAGAGPLAFVLSGASKLLALPQLKLAWIAAAGPPDLRDDALARLEFAADAFLSVSPLLARALPELLAGRAAVQDAIRARVAGNRARLAGALAGDARLSLLPAEAGWAAILRVAGETDEEDLALALLERAGVLVQPGFLFDLDPRDAAGAPCAHLVLSLLAEPAAFARGVEALLAGCARAV
jgi:aspartate/methionine/tyrosine aminotransferase